jgi:hypothetical protein
MGPQSNFRFYQVHSQTSLYAKTLSQNDFCRQNIKIEDKALKIVIIFSVFKSPIQIGLDDVIIRTQNYHAWVPLSTGFLPLCFKVASFFMRILYKNMYNSPLCCNVPWNIYIYPYAHSLYPPPPSTYEYKFFNFNVKATPTVYPPLSSGFHFQAIHGDCTELPSTYISTGANCPLFRFIHLHVWSKSLIF